MLIGIAKSNHSAASAIEAPAIALRTVGVDAGVSSRCRQQKTRLSDRERRVYLSGYADKPLSEAYLSDGGQRVRGQQRLG
ncbi:hypothetical protein, partial [Mycolicibacterium sp.]|uniref:hypothetical protein n=1 Tax=Mycolicibacterium sp. TaxID=2320850 RepID=UPI0037C56745